MPRNRKLKSALRSASEELNSITDLILLLQQRKEEKERQRTEDETAKRGEKRAERRLGIAERAEGREIADIADVKAGEVKTAGVLETARGSVGGLVRGQYRDVSTQAGRPKLPEQMASRLLGAQDIKQVETVRSDLLTGIEKMMGQIEQKDYLAGQPESIQNYLGALGAGVGEATAKGIHLKEEFPEKEPEVGAVTPRDKFLQEKVYQWRKDFTGKKSGDLEDSLKRSGWDGKKETFVYYRDIFIANQLNMNAKEQEVHLGRFAGVPGQVTEPGTPKTEVTPAEKPAEEFNVADHVPAGEEEKPQDVEAFIIGYIKEGRDVARLDVAKLAADYDMDEEEVRNIVSRFVNTAPRQ